MWADKFLDETPRHQWYVGARTLRESSLHVNIIMGHGWRQASHHSPSISQFSSDVWMGASLQSVGDTASAPTNAPAQDNALPGLTHDVFDFIVGRIDPGRGTL